MAYTTQQNASGLYEVFSNGQRIGTGDASFAQGYMDFNEVPTTIQTEPAAAVNNPNYVQPSYFSSERGAGLIKDAGEKIAKVSPLPPAAPTQQTTPTKTATDSQNSATVINPETEQSYSGDPNANAGTFGSLMGQGYQMSEGQGNMPSWMTSNDPEERKAALDAQNALSSAKSELAAAQQRLSSLNVANDPALQAVLAGINSQWQARIDDMQRANTSRVSAIRTTGIRMGSQYTGGEGGMMGSIISDEERQGISRIAQLQAARDQALVQAKIAYENQQWDRYYKQATIAQQNYENAVTELTKLQETAAKQDKAIQDALKEQEKNNYERFEKPLRDIVMTAAKNGAPFQVLAELDQATSVSEAIRFASNYLADAPSGELGDFLATNRYYRSIGQSELSYEQYQAKQDARKLAIAAAGRAGAPPTQAQVTYGNYAPRMETADATIKALTPSLEQMNPAWFLTQQQLPSFLQSTEVQSFNQAALNFVNGVLRQESGAAVPETEFARYVKQYFPQPGDSEKVVAQKAQNRAQIIASYKKNAGPAYIPPVGFDDQNTEEQAKDIILGFVSNNPQLEQEFNNDIQALESALGRKATYTELLQAYPEYNQ